jgi:hypothetical protein
MQPERNVMKRSYPPLPSTPALALAFSLAMTLGVVSWLGGCSDSTDPDLTASGSLRLYLVDAPGDYEAVNIVVTGIQAHRAGDDSLSGWFTVAADTDTVDLLQYTDGNVFMLADSTLPADHYTQLRLMVGQGSNVVVEGQTYPLGIPSGMQTGIKLNHPFVIAEDALYEATLDFDADRSIHMTGMGTYMLRPVIRVVVNRTSGSIIGRVEPALALAAVSTVAGMDTVVVFADPVTGDFELPLLPAGIFDVAVTPTAGAYQDTVITGVAVIAGQVTDLGAVVLQGQ